MSLVIIVPMLGRPHRVAPLLASIRATAPTARVLWALTPEDTEVALAIDRAVAKPALMGGDYVFVDRQERGDYARKINAGIAVTTEDHIFTAADDLLFHPGWYEAAVARLAPRIGVVGTNDRCNRRTIRGEHATHMLVTRSYVEQHGTIDEPGKFFHEGYPHELCDDEAVETAKKRRAWAHAHDSIVEHLHPMNGKAPMDESYAKQSERIVAGRPLFLARRKLWS